jgi:NADH:ubiquinone oxidoreductase subunit H
MLSIVRDEQLKEMGWKLLLQVRLVGAVVCYIVDLLYSAALPAGYLDWS